MLEVKEGSGVDEVKSYLDSRYVGSVEAVWRLMGKRLHLQEPACMALDVRFD